MYCPCVHELSGDFLIMAFSLEERLRICFTFGYESFGDVKKKIGAGLTCEIHSAPVFFVILAGVLRGVHTQPAHQPLSEHLWHA